MSTEKTKILILTAAVGSGHKSAARAIQTALEETYSSACEVNICNPFDEPVVPSIIRNAQDDHTQLVHDFPQFYAFGLRLTDFELTKGLGNLAGLIALSDAIPEIMERYEPDVVAATHPLHIEPLLNYRSSSGDDFRIATVVTDLARVHRLWYNEGVDLCLVPTEKAKSLAIKLEMPPEKLVVSGLAVNPVFGQITENKESLQRGLALDPSRVTILAVGSKRVLALDQFLAILNRPELPIQIIAVAGGDPDVHARLQEISWQIPVALFDYVEDMPQLMHAADCLLSKAGGLIVTEALAAGLPLLITQSTPIHEEGNADYVISEGAGDRTEDPATLLQTVHSWLSNDRALLRERTANAQRIGRPRAAYETARWLWSLAASKDRSATKTD